MSEWTGTVQARLTAGDSLIVCRGGHIKAKTFGTGITEAVGFWQGKEPFTTVVGTEGRTYLPAGAALNIVSQEVRSGLIIQGQRMTISGINQTIDDLQSVYDLNNVEIDAHDFAFTAGMQFLGNRQIFKGFVDGASLNLSEDMGDFSLIAVSDLRKGTRTFDAMLDTARDPFFKYVAAQEGDAWG